MQAHRLCGLRPRWPYFKTTNDVYALRVRNPVCQAAYSAHQAPQHVFAHEADCTVALENTMLELRPCIREPSAGSAWSATTCVQLATSAPPYTLLWIRMRHHLTLPPCASPTMSLTPTMCVPKSCNLIPESNHTGRDCKTCENRMSPSNACKG